MLAAENGEANEGGDLRQEKSDEENGDGGLFAEAVVEGEKEDGEDVKGDIPTENHDGWVEREEAQGDLLGSEAGAEKKDRQQEKKIIDYEGKVNVGAFLDGIFKSLIFREEIEVACEEGEDGDANFERFAEVGGEFIEPGECGAGDVPFRESEEVVYEHQDNGDAFDDVCRVAGDEVFCLRLNHGFIIR